MVFAIRICLVGLLGLFTAGCITDENFGRSAEMLRGNPAMQRDAIDRCYQSASRWPASRKSEMARIMNLRSQSNVARIFCQRSIAGIVSGRVSYSELHTSNPRFVRVIQGR